MGHNVRAFRVPPTVRSPKGPRNQEMLTQKAENDAGQLIGADECLCVSHSSVTGRRMPDTESALLQTGIQSRTRSWSETQRQGKKQELGTGSFGVCHAHRLQISCHSAFRAQNSSVQTRSGGRSTRPVGVQDDVTHSCRPAVCQQAAIVPHRWPAKAGIYDIAEVCPELEGVTAAFPAIRQEALVAERDQIPSYDDLDSGQYAEKWSVFFLNVFGFKPKVNRERCPQTCAAMENVPNLLQAFYSTRSRQADSRA